MTKARGFFLFSFCLLLSFVSKGLHAQHQRDRIPVQINCACHDEVGKAYLRALHERLGSSETFREASGEEASSPSVIHVDIASRPLAPLSGSLYGRTAIEILCERDGATMRQSVETCDRLPVDVIAQSMLTALKTL